MLHENIKDKQLIALLANASKCVSENKVNTEQSSLQAIVSNFLKSDNRSNKSLSNNEQKEINNEVRLLVTNIIEDVGNWSKKKKSGSKGIRLNTRTMRIALSQYAASSTRCKMLRYSKIAPRPSRSALMRMKKI